jgi:hypothetical protein
MGEILDECARRSGFIFDRNQGLDARNYLSSIRTGKAA